MLLLRLLILPLLAGSLAVSAAPAPLRVGIVGLAHSHVGGFLNGGALVPAGGALHRSDIQIVGIAEPDRQLFEKYRTREHFAPSLYFSSLAQLIAHTHPQAVLVFTNTFDHTRVVQECARQHVHVMMEKPLAVSYRDALAIAAAARDAHIHVLVDYETSWYASNHQARALLRQGALGDLRKVVVRDGHSGPKLIHVPPEFFSWLTDPKLNGAGALYDFGCYGADLMTWLMNGQPPVAVTAVTQHLQPAIYPKVDDEANVILAYPRAVAILEGSWNWPMNIKDMVIYGGNGSVRTVLSDHLEVRPSRDAASQNAAAPALSSPYDDPLHYLEAVVSGQISEDGRVSDLSTNVIASEILDAARRSAASGQTVKLPLHD